MGCLWTEGTDGVDNMATCGRKPKPTYLHVVEGTHNVTRHGKLSKAKAEIDSAEGNRAEKPKHYAGVKSKIWDRYIAPCPWIDRHMEVAAIIWCELFEEFTRAPTLMVAGRIAQMRALSSDLGLTDKRARGQVENVNKEDEADSYFDD